MEGYGNVVHDVASMLDGALAHVEMLDRFARHVMSVGFRPEDCLIESHVRPGETPFPNARHVLKVGGVPCFHVDVVWVKEGDMAVSVTASPKVLWWPYPKES